MKTNRFLLAGFVLVTLTTAMVLSGCKSPGATSGPGNASAAPAVSSTAPQKVELLFVQNAREVSFANGTMTLRGVNPVTVCFADRPERIAGHMPTSKIVPMWNEGTNSFTADPPNATLSMFSGDTVSNVVLVLRNPQLNGEDLSYEVRTLEGTPPKEGQACSLFIDIIGMPLTPYSYAGAARRAYRRGYVYPGAYGPAFVPAVRRPVVVY